MTTQAPRASWRGRVLIATAALHTLFAVALGFIAPADPQLAPHVGTEVVWLSLRPGFSSAMPPPLFLLALVWSVFFGVALGMLGVLVGALERHAVPLPRALPWVLLSFAAIGVVLMPASGFWIVGGVAVSFLRAR